MSTFRIAAGMAVALTATLFSSPATSHITLEVREAPIESRYKAVLRVPHGCQGSPTTSLRVRIPEGVIGVKPQPKAGWTIETVSGDYEQSYTQHGAQVESGVQEVIWTGGPLLDEHYDEFVFVGYLSGGLTPDTMLYFPIVQECEDGVARWIDTPSNDHGHSHSHDHDHHHDHADSPAPGLKLLSTP